MGDRAGMGFNRHHDDADNEHDSMLFVEEEGTQSSFRGVAEVIAKQGLFGSFYPDRGSHYWNTPEAGGKVDKVNLTQFGRGLKQIGIEMVAAYSPEARGCLLPGVPHALGTLAQGVGTGGHHLHGSDQPLSGAGLSPGVQRRVHASCHGTGQRVRAVDRRRSRRHFFANIRQMHQATFKKRITALRGLKF